MESEAEATLERERTGTCTVTCVLVFSAAEDDAPATLETYLKALEASPRPAELVLVNNGLGGAFSDRMRSILEEVEVPSKLLQLHRQAADSRAFALGFREATGDVVVTLPSYVQVAPEEIDRLVDHVASGELDCVASWRNPRVDSRWDAQKSSVFNALTPRVGGKRFHDLNCGLRAMRRSVVEDVPVYGDLFRFLPILASKHGYRTGEVEVKHVEERVRKGDYRVGVYLRRLLDLLTLLFISKFTSKPLRFFGLLGSAVLTVGIGVLAWVIFERLRGVGLSDRPMLVFGVLATVLGAQLFSVGLVGELIIFTHARDLEQYHVDKVFETPPG